MYVGIVFSLKHRYSRNEMEDGRLIAVTVCKVACNTSHYMGRKTRCKSGEGQHSLTIKYICTYIVDILNLLLSINKELNA